jgi:hypothetical protein
MNVRGGIVRAGVVLLALLAGACAGDTTGSGSPTAEGLESSARSFISAVIEGDYAKAYDFMNEECQSSKTRTEFAAETAVAMQMAEAFGLDLSKVKVTNVEVRNVSDGKGEVLTEGEVDGEPMSEEPTWDPWVFEEGSWRNIDCGITDSSGSSSSSGSGGATDTTVGGELRPSGEAQAEKELSSATTAAIGQTVDLGDGISVVVSGLALGEAYGDPAVAVTLRVENRGDDSQNPNVGVRCAGSTDDGMATSDGSSYETWAELSSGSFSEGVINVLPPSGSICQGPAYVWITPVFSFDDTAVKVPIDEALLAQLNA